MSEYPFKLYPIPFKGFDGNTYHFPYASEVGCIRTGITSSECEVVLFDGTIWYMNEPAQIITERVSQEWRNQHQRMVNYYKYRF